LRCFSLFMGKFQTFYANLIFAQNRQNWVLSTKSVNKSVFDNKKGMEKPPSGLDGFPFTKGEIHNVRLLRYVGIFFIVGKFSPFYSGKLFPLGTPKTPLLWCRVFGVRAMSVLFSTFFNRWFSLCSLTVQR
jgi:hypothetical protein